MLRALRRLLTVVALLILGAITLFGAYRAIAGTPPNRVAEEREALKAWLVSADASEESLSVQRHWVHRLEQDFRTGYNWQSFFDGLGNEEKARFLANDEVLTRTMLFDKADSWYSRPQKRREEYLDQEYADLRRWKLFGRYDAKPKRGSPMLTELSRNGDKWVADASPTQRQHFDDFRAALERIVWTREMRRWLPLK